MPQRPRPWRSSLIIVIASLICVQTAALAAEPPARNIHVGIVTGSNPDDVVNQWLPLVQYLTESVGRPFEIRIWEAYDDMLKDYRAGALDVLISGPLNYVTTHDKAGAILLAAPERVEGETFQGVIIARAGAPYATLADLKGSVFGFTEPYSTTGYLLPRLLMAKAGILQPADFFRQVVFLGHHSEAIDAVLTGRVDAAATVTYLVKEADPEGTRLKALALTPLLPPETIFARPSLDPEIVEKIRAALLTMHERVSPDILTRLRIQRFIAVSDETFDPIRSFLAEVEKLAPLPYAADYSALPAALAKAMHAALIRGTALLAALPAAAILLFLLASLVLVSRWRRDLRLAFAGSAIGVMLLVAAAVSGFAALDLQSALANLKLQWQRDIGVFAAQVSKAADDPGAASLIGSLTDGLAAQRGIRFVKVFRNGTYLADSEHRDAGLSIIPKILSDTFHLPRADGIIETATSIMAGDRRFATTQIGFDREEIAGIVRHIAGRTLLASLGILALGLVLALLWSRAILAPIVTMAQAVAAIRAGKRPSWGGVQRRDQLGELARGFQEMSAELSRGEEMLRLKALELEEAHARVAQVKEREQEIMVAIDEGGEHPGEGPAPSLETIRRELELLCDVATANGEEAARLREEINAIEEEFPKLRELRADKIIGQSRAFLGVIRDVIIRSRDSESVLLYGESGSGKTGVAQAIHALCSRGNRKLVEYNCAELAAADPVIVLGKLFGYGRESGIPGIAKEGQRGLLEECDGTTLFLDEIALLPIVTQGALLLPMEGRPFNAAAGKGPPRQADVRFIFASNQRLEEAVAAGTFRNDLLRRIKSRGTIEIPPLRDRMEDVAPLATHFLSLWRKEKGALMKLSDRAFELLTRYDYHHFNVAELATAVKVAADNAFFRGSDTIEPMHFAEQLGEVYRRHQEISDDARVFDAEEMRELAVLRRQQFSIAKSEAELGYAAGSKTLSNHLRGLSFKLLALAGWNAREAAVTLAGEASSAAVERLRRKMELYLQHCGKLVQSGEQERLFNNLPQKYRMFVEQAAERARRAGSGRG
jgi:phosphate/phosphite/phosphonate ABC transporter binding protein